jgi:hypothetical protein
MLNPNRHELVLFDPNNKYQFLSEWLKEYIYNHIQPFLVVPKHSKLFLSSNILKNMTILPILQPFIDYESDDWLWEVHSSLRRHIWDAVAANSEGVFFLFDFYSEEFEKEEKLKIEKMLHRAFQWFYGFPVVGACLYGVNMQIMNLLDLLPFHTDLRMRFDLLVPSQKWPVSPYRYEHDPKKLIRQELRNEVQLERLAENAFSESNEPFYFRDLSGEIVGAATNLPSLLHQLETIPIEVSCFHTFRTSELDLRGNRIEPVYRSDLALWVEYTLNDTTLAQQIYSNAKRTIGYYTDQKFASNFALKNTLSSLIQLIEQRVSLLSSYS